MLWNISQSEIYFFFLEVPIGLLLPSNMPHWSQNKLESNWYRKHKSLFLKQQSFCPGIHDQDPYYNYSWNAFWKSLLICIMHCRMLNIYLWFWLRPIAWYFQPWAIWRQRNQLMVPFQSVSINHYNDVIMSMMASQITSLMIVIPPTSTKLKGGYTGFTSYVRLSVGLSICGQNHVCSVASTIPARSISYLHILSNNFRRCVACKVCFKIQKFAILVNFLNL